MFVNLHRHDQFSTYDGFGKAKDVVQYTKKIGQKAIGLTNHGNVAGLIEHYFACKDEGIKPILGIEAYFVPKFKREKQDSYHLVLIAKNNKGYKNLMQIISYANENNFYYRPHVDFKLLRKHSEGLICMTACGSGLIPYLLNKGKTDKAKKIANMFLDIFGDDFYLEVMAHNMANQHNTNKNIIEFGTAMDIPIVMTLDSHYTAKDDFDTHLIMVSMKNEGFKGYFDAHIASTKEVVKIWNKNHKALGSPKEYIKNTVRIAKKCDVDLDFSNLIPKVGKNIDVIITKLAAKRLKVLGKLGKNYKARLKHEIKVVSDKGYADYFLICYDIIKFARDRNISMDFGRGSVGGSLLAYALQITHVDPIIHNTLFERFLRPDRTTLPDIDMDFDATRRHEIMEYIHERFGQGSAQIVSYGKWQIKNTIGDLCKLLGYGEDVKKELVKRIFEICGDSAEEIDYNEIMKDKMIRKAEKASGGMFKHFCKLYGQISYFGTHASGVSIIDGNIREYVGLMKSHDNLVTSFDKYTLDKLDILKLDILGLEAATILGIVNELTGENFNDSILTDKKTINAFKRAETDGIFQFEGRGAKNVLMRVQPDNFQELVACTAMNRPAPLKLGVVDRYVDGKNGNVKETPWYDLTEDTYGQIIYQEQVMTICRQVANMDWADIDKVLKDLKGTSNVELKNKFTNGAIANGYSRKDADELYDNMTLYLFNRAHGTAYTLVSFYAMWLMQKYPLEYIYAVLRREKNDIKLKTYEALAASKGIIMLLPHVNGTADYSIQNIDGQRVIQAGLSSLKGVGLKTAEEICSQGPFTCEEHVEQRVSKRSFNSKVREILKNFGALEFDQDLYEKRCARWNAALINDFEKLSD